MRLLIATGLQAAPHPGALRAPRCLLVLALALPLAGCQCGAGATSSTPAPADSSAAAASAALTLASAAPTDSAAAAPVRQIVGAAQILVAYKGAELAPTAKRSKEEARKRAEEALTKLKEGKASFEEIAKQYSDDPTKSIGGAMGNFERGAMPAAFSDAAFALKVGETSGIVETARGFHIIRRIR